ncbi:unnamed protein product [Cochlearia groenlandica]
MENQMMGETGGRRGKDDDDKNKDKKKNNLPLREEEKPRNRRYTEEEKGKKVKVPSWEDEIPSEWDWRIYQGIISNVLDQKLEAICWAITLVRAIEALLNINVQLENQHTLSIQHLRNNVNYTASGILEPRSADNYILSQGVLDEGECSYARNKTSCEHDDDVRRITVDDIVSLTNVDDMELREMVRRQPVIGILPHFGLLSTYRHGIYSGPKHIPSCDTTPTHAVLIVGYGFDGQGRAYWIVQSSWGQTWGSGGFGYISRFTTRGQGSIFQVIKYPVKEGYPKQNKKK